MHTYDYTLRGTVSLKAGVAPAQVEAALTPFLHYCRTSYAEALQRQQLRYTATELQLGLNFAGYYAPVADLEIMQLLAALRNISCGADYLELLSHDSSSADEGCTPLFIGRPEQLATAQLRYGIYALRTWAEPIIGSAAMDRLQAHILELAHQPRPASDTRHAMRSPTQEPG